MQLKYLRLILKLILSNFLHIMIILEVVVNKKNFICLIEMVLYTRFLIKVMR
jgi:hypothetical protein